MGTIFNTYLLPQEVQLVQFSPQGPRFDTPYAKGVLLSDLSDGYRTLLVLTLDLLRRLFATYWVGADMWTTADNDLPHTDVMRLLPGVVLIDELDAHLHPTLQREVALRLKRFFPELQFIIATHSPFITQAADDNGLYMLEQQGNTVQAVREQSSVRGWRVDQILAILFETTSAYDPETKEQLREYGRLKLLADEGMLTEEQAERLQQLQTWVDAYLAP